MTSALSIPRALPWTVALLFLFERSLTLVDAIGSFQNGDIKGAVYAGGMDFTESEIFITGITYGTNGGGHSSEAQCFIARDNSMKLGKHADIITKAIGDGKTMQACRAISVKHRSEPFSTFARDLGDSNHFYVAGTSDAHASVGTFQPSGFLVSLQNKDHEFPIKNSISTDEVGQTGGVSYPVSVKYALGVDEKLSTYVASLTSANLSENPGNVELMKGSKNQPNWMKYYKYGSSFELGLQKFAKSNGLVEAWTKIYPVDVDLETSTKPEVFVGGMILKRHGNKDFLVVAGSTSGSGEAYGKAAAGSADEDGFISVFDGHTGELRTIPAAKPNWKSSARIGTAETDLILGICHDPFDTNHFYIVGATGDPTEMGDQILSNNAVTKSNPGSLHGFVQKIEFNSLQKVWGKTWSADYGVNGESKQSITAGYDCQVVDDGSIYIAGVVEGGAVILRDVESDYDDIVAMQLSTKDGDAKWMKQFGSEDGNEDLARSGAIALDHQNNMIVLGDTTGSVFRNRADQTDNTSDIFLVTFAKEDGSHDEIVPSNHKGAWKDDHAENPKTGMLSGGKWKDDEVYGTSKWVDMTALGIQSGPTTGSIFAGGMVYDDSEDTVYLTGIAYSGHSSGDILSSCMLTKLSLAEASYNGFGSSIGKVIGEGDILEVCDSVALHGYGEVVVVGSADSGSALLNGKSYPMAGFAMAFDRFGLQEVDETLLTTKHPNNRIQYPIDVVSDGDDLYIVSLTSTDKELTNEAKMVLENGGNSKFSPNWINMKKYGKSFDMTVTKITLQEEKVDGVSVGDISFRTRWSKEFPVDTDGDNSGNIPRVFLGGAILKKSKGYLAVSGSTRGMGEAYGASIGNREDGFVTLLDMKTGELFGSSTTNNVREGSSEDDVVLGMCHDPNDPHSFYVVGGTKGKLKKSTNTTAITPGSTQAFLIKINSNTLKNLWAVQLGALHHKTTATPTTAKAFDCVVSGDTVYAGGVVDDNAGIADKKRARSSRGGDDIWLGSFSTDDGKINWVRQMGSDANDHMAPRGGLAINKKGNVLIYGDTTGQFFRRHKSDNRKVNELFLFEVTKEGAHKPHVQHQKVQEIPSPAPGGSAPAPSPGATSEATAPPFLVSSTSPASGLSTGLLIGFVVLGVLSAVILLANRYRKRGPKSSGPRVRDGIIVDTRKTFPPPSSFRDNSGFLDGSDRGSEDNLNIAAKDII